MFEIVSDLILDFAKLLPAIVGIILVMNICSGLLWGDR